MVKTVSNRRLVEIGRLVVRTDCKNAGKLGTIVNVVDQNRVILDGAGLKEGGARAVVNLKDIELTDFVTPSIGFGSRSAVVGKAVAASSAEADFAKTEWAQKLKIRAAKADLSDFERFQLRRAKRARNALVRGAYFKLLRASNGAKERKPVKKSAADKKKAVEKRAAKTQKRIKIAKEAKQ